MGCTCPDGQTYQVGDNRDGCASLACEGGTAGKCWQVASPTRKGYKVTCAQAHKPPTTPGRRRSRCKAAEAKLKDQEEEIALLNQLYGKDLKSKEVQEELKKKF